MNTKIDEIDEKIIMCLRDDGRITMKNLGEKVHLTGQAVKNRIEKLEAMGILQKYTVNIDCPMFGYKLHTLIRFQLKMADIKSIKKLLQEKHLRVIHCYQITGENLYVLDMLFLDMNDLNAFLKKIEPYGSYEVNIILKSIHDIED